MSQEEWIKLWESVPYVELYRYNPKHLYPKLNGYGDNGLRKCGHLAFPRTVRLQLSRIDLDSAIKSVFSVTARAPPNAIREYFITARYSCAI